MVGLVRWHRERGRRTAVERKLLLAAMAALRAALRMRTCCTRGLSSSYPDSHSLRQRVYVIEKPNWTHQALTLHGYRGRCRQYSPAPDLYSRLSHVGTIISA